MAIMVGVQNSQDIRAGLQNGYERLSNTIDEWQMLIDAITDGGHPKY